VNSWKESLPRPEIARQTEEVTRLRSEMNERVAALQAQLAERDAAHRAERAEMQANAATERERLLGLLERATVRPGVVERLLSLLRPKGT
jgi:hypothetical protein